MRTSNLIERTVNQQIKQRTRKVRVFPNEQALLRLVTSVVIRIDKDWVNSKSKNETVAKYPNRITDSENFKFLVIFGAKIRKFGCQSVQIQGK